MKRFEVIADRGAESNILIHASNTDDRIKDAVKWAGQNGFSNIRVIDLFKMDAGDINKMFVKSINV